jgi:hypothetical protein
VNGTVDQVHASLQIQDAPFQAYSDALDGTGAFQYAGGVHYPRGITSALWWLNATNNPPNPVPTSAPVAPAISSALAGDRQVLLLWQGVPLVTGYNIKRANISGGPYTTLTNGVVGASFVDSSLSNGTTYYYILTAANEIGEGAPSPEASATPVPSAGTTLVASRTASALIVSWPSNYLGWILQTNTVGLGNAAAWHDVPGSLTNSQMTFPTTDRSTPSEFFRLRHP